MNENAYELESASKAADVLAQAPNLTKFDAYAKGEYYSPNFYDYYYDVVTTAGTVYVRKLSDPDTILYQTSTSKTV